MASNVETLRAAHGAFNDRDFRGSAGLLASDAEFTDHARGVTFKGPDEFVGWLEGFMTMSSDLKIVDATYIDAGDWVTARFRGVGTQDGPIEVFPASNMPYSLDICEVWHFNADGKADEGHNYSDGLGLMMQLGHIQAPE